MPSSSRISSVWVATAVDSNSAAAVASASMSLVAKPASNSS